MFGCLFFMLKYYMSDIFEVATSTIFSIKNYYKFTNLL